MIGLGRFGGGVGVTRWLVDHGAHVTVTDRADARSLAASIDALADLDVTFHLGGHDLAELNAKDLAVINPAVIKSRSDLFRAILRQKIEWTTELNLFCERCPAPVIGITGTYGKSTTSAMLASALEACRPAGDFTGVHLGGNIGHSLLTELDAIRPTDWVILEMSSAQLEDLPRIGFAPRIAVVTNLSPHHLDRYRSYAEYVSTKLRMVGDPSVTQAAIIGPLDADAEGLLRSRLQENKPRVVRVPRPEEPIGLSVPGDHQQDNAACVLAVCRELGLNGEAVRRALRSFAGLPHRLEHVRTLRGVDYYNDSKSTSPRATITAIASLDRPIVAIVGGEDRDVPLGHCAEMLSHACRLVICQGASRRKFARALAGVSNRETPAGVCEVKDLEAAVMHARAVALPADVVLFSPGAASYDAYANFVERGRHFVELVHALA